MPAAAYITSLPASERAAACDRWLTWAVWDADGPDPEYAAVLYLGCVASGEYTEDELEDYRLAAEASQGEE